MMKSVSVVIRRLAEVSMPATGARIFRTLFVGLLGTLTPVIVAQQTATGAVSPATPTYADKVTGIITIPGVTTGSADVTYTVDGGSAVTVTADITNGNAYLSLGQYAIGAHALTVQSISATSTQVASGQAIRPQGHPVASPVLPPQAPIPIKVVDLPFAFISSQGPVLTFADGYSFSVTGVICDDHDNLYAADFSLNRVQYADNIGNITTLPLTGLANPYGLAFDAAGNLYIADYTNQRVIEYSKAGVQTTLSIPNLGRPTQLAADKTRNLLYIEDPDNNRILSFDLGAGAVVSTPVSGAAGLVGISIAPNGDLYYSVRPGGFFHLTTGGVATPIYVPGDIVYTGGIYVDRKGTLYVNKDGEGALLRIDSQGNSTRINGGGNGNVMADDSFGNIYVSLGPRVEEISLGSGRVADTTSNAVNEVGTYLTYTMPSGQSSLTTSFAPVVAFDLGSPGCPGEYLFGTCIADLGFRAKLPGLRVGNAMTSLSPGGPTINTLLYGRSIGAAPAFSPGTQTSSAAGTTAASGVFLDQLGNYFASDASSNQVFETVVGGTPTALAFTGLSRPTTLAVDGLGAVYVLDSGNNRIVKLDAAHNQTNVLVAGQGNALSSITAFAVDGGGQIFYAGNNGTIYLDDYNGVSTPYATGLGTSVGLALDLNDDVYTLQQDGSVVRIDPYGVKTTMAQAGTFANPIGFAVDSSQTAYVAQNETGTVQLVHPDGTTLSIPVPALSHTAGISIDGFGSILAVDSVTNQYTFVDRTHQDYNFGDVTVNTTQTFNAYYTNSGTSPFTIGGVNGDNDFKLVTTPDACDSSPATTTIPAAGSCNLSYTVAPTATGLIATTGRVTTSASVDFDSFSENVVATATLTLTPALDFGDVSTGTTSSKTLMLTNNSTSTVTITGASVTGAGFQDQPGSCGTTLAAGASCTLGVSFKPSAAGGASGTYELTDSVGTQYATLTGNGATGAPVLAITPPTFAFGSAIDGSTPQTTTLVVKNTGTLTNNSVTVKLTESDQTSGTVVASFTETTTCGTSLAVNATCTIVVTFTPHAGETATGTLTVTGDTGVAAAVATLTGTGVAAASAIFTTRSFDFGSVTTGSTTPGTTFTLSNNGGTPLTVSSLTITGSGAAAFAIVPGSSTCSTAFAANSSCTFKVTFSPTATNPYAATVSAVDQAGTQTLTLTGTGVNPSGTLTSTTFGVVSTGNSSVNFGNVSVGTNSAQLSNGIQQVNFTNTSGGSSSLLINSSNTTITGPFAVAGGSCPTTAVTPGHSCSINLAFAPTTAGPASGTLTIALGPGVNLVAKLTGTGVNPSGTLTSATFGIVSMGNSSVNFGSVSVGTSSAQLSNGIQQLNFTNTSSASNSLLIDGAHTTITGPFVVAGGTCPAGGAVTPGQSCSLNLAFAPTTAGPASGTLTISLGQGVNVVATLTGTGVNPSGTLTSTTFGIVSTGNSSVNFGSVSVGTSSAQLSNGIQQVNFTNTSSASNSLLIDGAHTTITGPFVVAGGTCPTGGAVTPGQSCSLNLAFAPTTAGPASGTLTIALGQGVNVVAKLTGTGVAPPSAATLSPTSLAFGNVTLGSTSSVQNAQLNNTGTASYQLSSITTSDPAIKVTTSFCVPSVAPGAYCQLNVTLTPSVTGAFSGSVVVNYYTGNGATPAQNFSSTLTITGTGVAPNITLTPATFDFGSVNVSQASSPHAFTVTNGSTAAVTISRLMISGPYQLASGATCAGGAQLPAGQSCTIPVTFMPTTSGASPGSLQVSYIASGSAITVTSPLTGTGTGIVVTLLPTSLSFGNVTVGTTSATQFLTLTNTSSALQSYGGAGANNPFDGIEISGGTCPAIFILQPGASCTIGIAFKPAQAGAVSDMVSVGVGSLPYFNVAVTGNGVAPVAATLLPTSLNFGNVTVGTTSATQFLTLTNTSSTLQSYGGAGAGNPFDGIEISGGTCPAIFILQPGASCTIGIAFKPAQAGAVSDVVNVGVGSLPYFNVPVTGNGVALSSPPDFTIFNPTGGAISLHHGGFASLLIDLGSSSASAPFTAPVTFSATGLPAGVTASFAPSTLTPGNGTSTTLTVTAAPVMGQSKPMSPPSPGGRETAFGISAVALMAGLFGFRKRLNARLLLCLCALGLISGALGCGSGSGFNIPTTTSNINVTATSGSISHTISVTLTVQ